MKSTVTPRDEKSAITYPCLMKWKGGDMIVLFINKSEGSVIYNRGPITSSSRMLGEHDDGFSMNQFEPFHGTVTMEND